MLGGIDIVVSDLLPRDIERKQVRFPKSRRRRIRKKWAKDPRNWRSVEKPVMYQMGKRLFVNRVAYAQLLDQGLEWTSASSPSSLRVPFFS